MASGSHLLDLADEIEACTQQISGRLRQAGLREPHYGVESPRELWESPELGLKDVKAKLVEATTSLQTLVMGPMAFHRNWFGSHYDLAALQVLLEFHVLENIPAKGSIDLETLAKTVQLDPDGLGRLLRLVGTQRYVEEPHLNVFQHTMLSELLLRDELLRAQGGVQLVDMHKASVGASDYLRKKNFCLSDDSPFKHKWGLSIYEYYDENPVQGARFAKAMQGIQRFDRPAVLLAEWIKDTDRSQGKMIDVGGGNGHVALNLAKQFPAWHFVVQDLHEVMYSESSRGSPTDLLARVSFQHHNFFTPQPQYEGVDAWVLRQCLHNWNDQDSLRILRGFLPAMEANPKTALLINETIIPKRGDIPLHEERQMRQIDLAMFVATNTKQRTEREWRTLVKDADSRLRVTRVLRDKGTMGLIEIHLDSKQLPIVSGENGANGEKDAHGTNGTS